MSVLLKYKNFLQGIAVLPKAAVDSQNSALGEIEVLTSTNKLYFHNGTINDPIVQENVAATLANKILTAPVINNSTADTITGIAGGQLLIQSASNQNLSLQAQGTGVVLLQGTNAQINNSGLSVFGQRDARFYDSDNSNYVGIDASATVPSDYTITLPANQPTANTALVYDGVSYKWGAAGGADSAGANDDILATAFRARILDSFDDAPTLSSSTINSATTTATHVPANQLYAIQYDATQTLSGGGTTYSLGAQPSFTLAVGDVLVAGTEVRKITVLGSPDAWVNFTIESAFVGSPSGACIVSQTVSSKELYGSTFDGDSIADAFSNTDFSEYLIDYQDSTTTIYETSIAPKVSYSVSQDGTTWSDLASRPQYQTDQIQSGSFATADNALYVRLFANTTGSGTVNLLEYRAYMQKSPSVASGILNAAYAKFDGSISPQNCTVATVLGKTQVTLSWPYTKDVNNPSAFGSIDVYINGQFIPRQVGTYLPTSSWAFYKEITQNIIELDSDYSSSPYAIQIVQRQPIGNFTSSTGGSSSSSGDGLKNYLTTYLNNSGNGNFEVGDTSGWSLFNTTLTSKVPTGSITAGAASITTFTTTASTPLAGSFSLSVGSSGVLSAGQGFITNAFTIDREDRAKVLTFNFSYEAVSGTMDFSGSSNNTWAIYLYDGTNWIQPAGVYSMVQSSGVGYASGTFQTSSTATSYRLAVICITATGGAVSLKFDDFFVGPQVSVNAPAMSDWQSYTPAAAIPGFGTCTNLNFKSRRVGDSLEVFAYFTSGTPSGAVQIPLGFNGGVSNVTVDTSKVPPSSIVGKAAQSGFSATYFSLAVLAPATNQTFVNLGLQTSTLSETTAITSNTITSSTLIELFFKVPIVGWSSNTVASADTDTRVVAASGYFNAVSLTGSESQFSITSVSDSHAAFTSNSYVVPVSGYYQISAYYIGNTSSATLNNSSLRCKVGGVLDKQSDNYGSFIHTPVLSYVRFLNAGNILTFFGSTDGGPTLPVSGTSSTSGVSIQRLSGPAVVQATETVAARYNIAGAVSISTTQPVNYATKVIDTHNAVTTGSAWKFTAPVSGIYRVSTALAMATSTATLTLRKNGINEVVLGSATTSIYGGGSQILRLNAGEYIDVVSDTTSQNTNAFTSQSISIERIGN